MEPPQGAGKPLSQRRARSWDRSQKPRGDPESREGRYLSLPATPPRRAPAGRPRDSSQHRNGPGSREAPGSAALSLEAARELLPSEQRPPRDKKDKAQSRSQQGWLKAMLNFFLRTGPEEAKDKAARRARAKEGLASPSGTSEPAPRKKAHDKKHGHRKHGHRKHGHGDGDARGAPGQEAGGREAAAAWRSQEADPGPGPRGAEAPDPQQSVLVEGRDAGASKPSSHAASPWPEEGPQKLDQDTVIQMIVQLLRDVGDEWDEEVRDVARFFPCPLQLQGAQQEEAPQNPSPAVVRKKSQERKSRRTSSHKKHGSEEPRRAGAADASSPESRPSKRPSFLYLCVGGQRASISSSVDLEEPEVQEASSTDCGGLSAFELPTHAGSREPGEDLPPGRASECKEFIQKILALLQDAEEQEGEKQLQAQEPEPEENPAPPSRKKSQEKKSSFRKAFSQKKHGSKEPKRAGAAGAASPEPRRPRRPSHLALCVGGHRPSVSSSVDPEDPEFRESSPAEGGRVGSPESPSQAGSHEPEGRPLPDGACESKEQVIQQLVALLPGVDGHLGEQIRRHPSLKKFFYQLPDSSLRKLSATLRSRGACPPEPRRGLTERPYQFAFDLANKSAGRNGHASLSLMGLRLPRLPHSGAQQNITSLDFQSPD